jgi:hypothetical protein
MPDSSTSHPHNPGRYVIRLQGHLAPRWATRFDGMTLTTQDDGTTVIEGPVADQAALHGLLHTLGDLALPLVSVAQLHPDPQTPPVTAHHTPRGD